jgi:hypothetical protein
MILSTLILAAGTAFAQPAPKPKSASAEDLAVALAKLRRGQEDQVRASIMGGAEELRDAVAVESGPAKKTLMNRLPGMSQDPFHICRALKDCKEAPLTLHVEDQNLADDAFLALARPWFKLQEARGKAIKLSVDRGTGVKLELEDLPGLAEVTLTASPTPTGGFDVAVEDGEKAAKAYAAARAAALPGS